MTEPNTLLEYEEIIINLADELGGLSTVHRGVGDATESLVAAHRELASLQHQLQQLLLESQKTLQAVEHLEPKRLETSFNREFSLLSSDTKAGFEALEDELKLLQNKAVGHSVELTEQLELLNDRLEAQTSKVQQFGSLLAALVNGSTPYQQDVLGAAGNLRTSVEEVARLVQRTDQSVGLTLDEIEKKVGHVQQSLNELANRVDQVRSVASRNLASSESLGTAIASEFDTMQRGVSDETSKLFKTQLLVIILCFLVLASIWLKT